MKTALSVASILAAVLAFSPLSSADGLKTSSGTMQLGGTATFGLNMAIPSEGDSTTGETLGIAPNFGYFIIDNLELNGSVGLGMFFGDLYDKFPTLVSFSVGANYFIPIASFYLHLGANIGMRFNIPDGEGDTTKSLPIVVPVGLLMPLNDNVALDLGMRINYTMSLEDKGTSIFSIPVGYLGVQAFF